MGRIEEVLAAPRKPAVEEHRRIELAEHRRHTGQVDHRRHTSAVRAVVRILPALGNISYYLRTLVCDTGHVGLQKFSL